MGARIYGEKIWVRIAAVQALKNLPQWDQGFIESISEAYKKWKGLTPKQFETFKKIEKRNSAEAQEERLHWDENYTDEMREQVLVCAKYYLYTGYFLDLARKILDATEKGEDIIISPKQYRAMTHNKFATKILNNHFAEPLFKVGEMAMFRRHKGVGPHLHGKIVTILEHPNDGHRPAKGGKAVEVFVHELSLKYKTHERDLKVFKG